MKILNVFRSQRQSALFFLALIFAASGLFRLADGTGRAVAADSPPDISEKAGVVTGGEVEMRSDPDAKPMTLAEIDTKAIGDLLTVLKEREAALNDREEELQMRSAQLDSAQQLIQENLAALEAAEASLEATLALADGAMERDIEKLTKVYESMKSKDAAVLFETMDPNFAAGFLARMKPESAAGVMAGLTPETAYSISVILAGRNREVPLE